MKKRPRVIWTCRKPERWGDPDEPPDLYYDKTKKEARADCRLCCDRKGATNPFDEVIGVCPGPVKYVRAK
jgi:hypothetical protein